MAFLVSLLFGIVVGVAYALFGIKSPAPPIVALFGLLGIVIGEQGVIWLRQPSFPSTVVQHDAGQPQGSIEASPGRTVGEGK